MIEPPETFLKGKELTPEFLYQQTVGAGKPIDGPFGTHRAVYADFTATGRKLHFVEIYLRRIAAMCANTHTRDSATGRFMTQLFHDAIDCIGRGVRASENDCIIPVGTGSTGAIHKFQEILGISIPPASKRVLQRKLNIDIDATLKETLPLVFVGPYEHHSNEVTWREGLCEVVRIPPNEHGEIDLTILEEHLIKEQHSGRRLIGSFSAGSNVTGILSPVHAIAKLLHRYGAIACFDFAAAAPYVQINMNPKDPEEALDAIFVSHHKYLGGPGSVGVLVFKKELYAEDVGPSIGGGGSVLYVGRKEHDFLGSILARETAGTPGIFQTFRAALAEEIKAAVGADTIHEREQHFLARAFARWNQPDSGITVLGNLDPNKRIGIVSFSVAHPSGDGILHPRFVTVLLNDLFGIQSRAGCSCAGPYGHDLLEVDDAQSEAYRKAVRDGYEGIKPGWCRVGFHYSMDDVEVTFIIQAVEFVAAHGHRFLPLYTFDLASGAWKHKQWCATDPQVSLSEALQFSNGSMPVHPSPLSAPEREALYDAALTAAHGAADLLSQHDHTPLVRLPGSLGTLQYFALPESSWLNKAPSYPPTT